MEDSQALDSLILDSEVQQQLIDAASYPKGMGMYLIISIMTSILHMHPTLLPLHHQMIILTVYKWAHWYNLVPLLITESSDG